jgi:hypothetical protein
LQHGQLRRPREPPGNPLDRLSWTAEVVGLRRQDCDMPATGWGRLTLEKSRPEFNRRWTDEDQAQGERSLKHRAADRAQQRCHLSRPDLHQCRL